MSEESSTKRKMPVKLSDVLKLDGEYKGWEFKARLNPPLSIFEDIGSGRFDRIITGLSKVVVWWNFVDEEGEPLLSPNEGGCRQISTDLAGEVVRVYTERLTDLPPG